MGVRMQTCQELIWIDPPHSNTYCMREKGHPGKHNIVNEGPCEKEKTPAKSEPAQTTS
jgi:hypothetical protein